MDPEEHEQPPSALAQLLQSRLKTGLAPTTTKVTQSDGNVTIFKAQGLVQTGSTESPTFGFVVDTKPDLTVGHVRPWLLVSSQDVASDVNLINQLGITHILSLLPGFDLNPAVKCQIVKHLVLDFYDEECFDMSTGLPLAMVFINEAKASGGKVLVHCNAGISRAPTLVILYLMKFENLSFDEAWVVVKGARTCAKPNEGFLHQMKEFKFKSDA